MSGNARATARRVPWLLFGGLLLGWWFTLAPTTIGGSAGFVVVDGTSMEPLLHTGDLVITHKQDRYQVGDLVVVNVDGGRVVHRLHDGDAAAGWHTKGDNRRDVDSWLIHPDDIVGRQWQTVPGFLAKASVIQSPWAAPSVAAATAFLLLIPGRRKKNPRLAAILELRQRTPWTRATPLLELVGLGAAALCALVSSYSTWVSLRDAQTTSLIVTSAGLAVSIVAAAALYARLFRGTGLAEPRRSFAMFGTDVVDVSALPHLEITEQVPDPRSLLKRAEAERLPIVHTASGSDHRFVLVTDDEVLEYLVPGSDGDFSIPPPAETERSSELVTARTARVGEPCA